jgi:iduronate 2-sulfatase
MVKTTRILAAALTMATLLVGDAIGSAAERRNVLLICVDDLKPMLACYGDTTIQSPNVDRLAARGIRFDRAYCNQAVCAPSRNALLTGLRPSTLGIYDLPTNFRKAAPDAVTLPQHFKRAGYRTESLGKIFHVGHGNVDDPVAWSVPSWKAQVVSYALPENQVPQGGLTREAALFDNKSAATLPKGAAWESADVADDVYPDGRVADEAIRRLQSAKQKPDEPFFLAVGFVKPHLPFCAPKKYWDLYKHEQFEPEARQTPPDGAPPFAPTIWGELRNYADIPEQGPLDADLQRTLIHGYHAATSYMDAQLGRVLDALDETGLAKNTVIVLWGDHGWHLGDHGMWCKHTNYEQAARIPVIVSVPGQIPGATDALIESVDIYPTLCELTGIGTPAGLDGSSFAATISDPKAPTKDAILHVYPRAERIGRALRTERYRLVEWKEAGASPDTAILELYDYETDPAETRNLAAERPEVVAELRSLLARYPEAKPQFKAAGDKKNPSKAPAKKRKDS